MLYKGLGTFLCYTVIDVLYKANIFVAGIKRIVTLFISNLFRKNGINKICKNPFFFWNKKL